MKANEAEERGTATKGWFNRKCCSESGGIYEHSHRRHLLPIASHPSTSTYPHSLAHKSHTHTTYAVKTPNWSDLPSMSKLLTVFGATGNQGGSVIKAVLADAVLSKEYKIRGITRDVTKPAAQALTAQGVEMISVGFSFSQHRH